MTGTPENQSLIFTLYILLAAITLRLLSNRYKPGLRDIPGPRIAKYTRLWKLHSVWKGDHHQTEIALHKKYGPLVRIGPNHVSVGDPSAVPIIYGLNKGFTKVCIASNWNLSALYVYETDYHRRPSSQFKVYPGTKSLK